MCGKTRASLDQAAGGVKRFSGRAGPREGLKTAGASARLARMNALPALRRAAAVLAGGCRVRDVRTAELRVPAVADEASLAQARAALRTLPDSRLSNRTGDDEKCLDVQADFASGTLKVRYDSMKVGTKNRVDALAKAGFEAEEIRGDAR